MKPQLTMIAVSLILAGCGGGSTGNSTTSTAPTYTAKGKVAVTAARSGTTVCVDYNENLTCDKGEPTAKTDANGEFAITDTSKKVYEKRLVAKVAANGAASRSSTNSNFITYVAPPRNDQNANNVINGISTMIAAAMDDGLDLGNAQKQVTSQLKAAGIDLQGDLIDNLEDNALVTLEKNMVEVLGSIASESGDSQTKMISALYRSFVDTSADRMVKQDLITKDWNAAEITSLKEGLSKVADKVYRLNDTGVTLYFTDKGNADVSEAQADFPGQDADYGLDKTDKKATTGNGFDFVKLDAAGRELADDAANWSCVLDKRSNLVWENKLMDEASPRWVNRLFALEIANRFTPHTNDVNASTCKAKKDSHCTTQNYADYLNQQKLCGITTWRLPTGLEFYNILNFGETKLDKSGEVYGLTVKYFPHQATGNPDYEVGTVWSDSLTFNDSTKALSAGKHHLAYSSTRGFDYRGQRDVVEVWDSTYKPEEWESTSFILPTRMVSAKGN